MNNNVITWKEYRIGDLFDIRPTKMYKDLSSSDLNDGGTTPFVVNSGVNNGIGGHSSLEPTEPGNIITFSDTTDGNTFFFQPKPFIGFAHVQGMYPKTHDWNKYELLFLVTLLTFHNSGRFNYGRKMRRDTISNEKIKLPTSGQGVPDWEWIKLYINNLHNKPITTKNRKENKIPLDIKQWQNFLLHQLFNASMGSGIDAIATTQDKPSINYVGRRGDNNGVMSTVDRIEDVEPFPAGSITLALGGSLGACFVQPKQFYTSQNVAVLSEKEPLTTKVKLFITSIISNECKLKYQAFGRELNSHFRKDFTLKLPILLNPDGTPKIDTTCKYSERGFIPDWGYMEKYMGSLPYGDRL